MALVSVIVPVYKVEKYLKHCIDSILSQSFYDFELILIDDGSPDDCPMICDNYMKLDKRIRVIHKNNGGVAQARNVGLDIASGKYVTFCDSDDYWSVDWLESLYEAMTSKNVDCVSAKYSLVNDRGHVLNVKERGIDEFFFNKMQEKFDFISTKVLSTALGWEVTTRIFKMDIIKANNIKFCEKCENFAEDLGFTLEYTLCSTSAKSINCAGYFYVQHDDSMMHRSVDVIKLNAVNEVSMQVAQRYLYLIEENNERNLFPIMHFLIMNCQYCKVVNGSRYPHLMKEVQKIQNKEWYVKQTKDIFKRYSDLKRIFGIDYARRILLLSNYCIHGNWKRYKIESAIYYKVISKL